MYSTEIEIKNDVSSEMLNQLKVIIENAFSNRVGIIRNTSNELYRFRFAGGDMERGCLDIGLLTLKDEKKFISNVSSWQWIDHEEPDESCDILKEFSILTQL